MMNDNGKPIRVALVVGLLALVFQANAFSNINAAQTRYPMLVTKPLVASQANSHSKLSLFNDENSTDDWKDAAGKLGRQAWNLIETGGSKLKDLAVKGTETIKTALAPSNEYQRKLPASIEREVESETTQSVDTEDADLFCSLLQNQETLPDPFATAAQVEQLIDVAASLLEQVIVATAVLGGSIQYGSPTIHSRRLNQAGGETVEASFDVWGLQGKGTANVVAVDGEISFLALQVDGQFYQVSTNDSTPKASRIQEDPQPWEPEEAETVLEVEVLEGVRRLNPPNGGRIIDAEIVDEMITL